LLAKRLGVSEKILSDQANGKRPVPAKFVSRLEGELESIHAESLRTLRAKNLAQLGEVRFNLYHNVLPITPITQLPASPVYTFRPPSGQPLDYRSAIPWDRWSEEASRRANGVYTNASPGKGDHVTVLMGSPGAGKSTELKRLLLLLQDRGMTCIFVPLSVYNSPGPEGLFEAARVYYVDKLKVPVSMKFERLLRLEVSKKRLVMFLDSLDEADAPHRKKIIGHANDLGGSDENDGSRLRVPLFFSSRYVPPRLDLEPAMADAQHWHLAGLKPEQALAHIETIRAYLESRGNAPTVVVSIGNFVDRMRNLARYMRSLIHAHEDGKSRDGDAWRGSESSARRAARNFDGLAHPLFLHLHIGLCLDRGDTEWSMDAIIARYVEFLLGRWMDSRSENPQQRQRDEGKGSLERALAYLGFHLTLREHMEQMSPAPEEVEKLLVDYFRKMAQTRTTDEDLSEFVQDQLQRARTAEIFEPDNPNQVRFGAPADVLRQYHVAQFIEQSTAAQEAEVWREKKGRAPVELFPALRDAGYSTFLTNPNVRFLEPGMILYFQSLFENPKFVNSQVQSRFEEAMQTPPMKLSSCGCTEEELKKVLPLNLMFLGRALEGDVTHRYRNLFEELHAELNPIFDNTNFATVFDALFPIVRPLEASGEFDLDFDALDSSSPADVDRMNKLWRRLPNAQLLMRLADRISPIDDLEWDALQYRGRKIVLRRIVYQLRHHAETFDDAALDWLRRLHDRCLEFDVAATVMSTARVIRTTLPQHVKFDWSYFDDAENAYRADVNQWKHGLSEAWERSKHDASAFVNHVTADNERFPFTAIQRTDSYLNELISSDAFNRSDAIFAASRLLETSQDNSREGKTLLFLRHIAGTYRGQQLLMPADYRLHSVERAEPPDSRYSAEDLLRRLFSLVKPHLAHHQLTPELAGEDHSSLGGLQLYDWAVEVIWAILWNRAYARDSREDG